MLSFSTEFPVVETTAGAVSESVAEWVQGSPHTVFKNDDIIALRDVENGSVDRENQSVEIITITDGDRISKGFRHTALDAGVVWVTTIVYCGEPAGHWIGIRTDRHSIDPQIRLKDAKKPQIVRVILADIGGGLDGEIYVKDSPVEIRENDLNMAARLINGDSDNYLPVVYVSRNFDDELPVNTEALARTLGGLAHVIVEPSRQFSLLLQSETDSRNPYGGAVGIHLPTGQRWVLLPSISEQEIRLEAVRIVRSTLANRRPLAKCSWDSLEAEKSRIEIERLRSDKSTDLDAYIKAFDQENRALKATLSASESENSRLKTEINHFIQRDNIKTQRGFGKIRVQDYFDGESDSVLRDALESAMVNTTPGSRREIILKQAIIQIPENDELKKRRDKLKDTLRDSRGLDSDTRETLRYLGFSIDSSGKHHKLVYNGDESFTFSMSKTAGDHRSGLNLASDIAKKIY